MKTILVTSIDDWHLHNMAALIHALNNVDGKVLIADGKMTTVDLSKPETFKYENTHIPIHPESIDLDIKLIRDISKHNKGVKALDNYLHNQNNKKNVRKHMLKHTKRKK